MNDDIKKSIVKESLGDGGWHVPHPFVVDCVFQKYGVKNANGRVYPEAVLRREVERYQKLIDAHQALRRMLQTKCHGTY